jgi:hypothetical protein
MNPFPSESIQLVFKTLEGVIENGKWRTKAAALDAMRTFINGAEEDSKRPLPLSLLRPCLRLPQPYMTQNLRYVVL